MNFRLYIKNQSIKIKGTREEIKVLSKSRSTNLHLSALPDVVQVVVNGHEVQQVGEEAQALLSGLQLGEVHSLQPSQAGHHLCVMAALHQLPTTQLREDAFAIVLDGRFCRYETSKQCTRYWQD